MITSPKMKMILSLTTHDPTDPILFKTHCNTPEKSLLLAVLIDAYKDATERKGLRREEARTWFSSHSDGFLTFEMICYTLGLDPDYLRKALTHGYVITEQNRGIRSNNATKPVAKRERHHVTQHSH